MKKTDFQLDIIHIIRKLRNDKHLSQAGLSDILNISYGLIGNIESAKYEHKYTIEQLAKICKYFDYPFEKLFLKEEELVQNTRKTIDLLRDRIIKYYG